MKRIRLDYCEILPPRFKLPENLQLENLTLDNCYGEGVIFSKLLMSHPIERIDLNDGIFSRRQIDKIIESLPKIGKELKCLNIISHGSLRVRSSEY